MRSAEIESSVSRIFSCICFITLLKLSEKKPQYLSGTGISGLFLKERSITIIVNAFR